LNWLLTYWYISWSVAIGIVLLAFAYRWLNHRRGGQIIIQEVDLNGRPIDPEPGKKMARKSMFTLRAGAHNVVRKNKEDNVVVALHRQYAEFGEKAPNEGFYRLQALFPTASDNVIHTIMECSPHEEAAVYRLLLLGYPMNKLTNYQYLAYAGRRHRMEKKAKLRKQREEALAREAARRQAEGVSTTRANRVPKGKTAAVSAARPGPAPNGKKSVRSTTAVHGVIKQGANKKQAITVVPHSTELVAPRPNSGKGKAKAAAATGGKPGAAGPIRPNAAGQPNGKPLGPANGKPGSQVSFADSNGANKGPQQQQQQRPAAKITVAPATGGGDGRKSPNPPAVVPGQTAAARLPQQPQGGGGANGGNRAPAELAAKAGPPGGLAAKKS